MAKINVNTTTHVPAPIIWVFGLSQAGKTELAAGLSRYAERRQIPTQILDGRDVRSSVGDFFGYSREERIKVSRVMGSMASLLSQNGIATIVTAITPYAESRKANRAMLDNYFEIYLRCSVETCQARDTSGNYARAMRGDLRHFIGVDDPFDVPAETDLAIDTERHSPEESLELAVQGVVHLFET